MLHAGVAVGIVLAGSITLADDTMLKVKEGDKFPDMPLQATQIDKLGLKKKTVTIGDLKGKNVVIVFYPKALTRGCTIESCGFRDIAKDFPADTVLLGASGDDMALQQKFIDTRHAFLTLCCATRKQELIKDLGNLGSPSGGVAKRVDVTSWIRKGRSRRSTEGGATAKHPKEVLNS